MSEENRQLTEVKTAMLLHCPFFASIMLDHMTIHVGKFPEIFGNRTPTAATNGKGIWFDMDFWKEMKLPQRVFVMCHEIAHAMWMHMSRAKKYMETGFDGHVFDAGRWNRAGDYVINDMLVNCKIGKMPDCGLHDPSKYTSVMSADEVYRLLEDDPEDGDGPGEGEGGTMDHHIAADSDTTEAEMKRVVASAADTAKSQGKLPADLERFVEQMLNPKVAWSELLRKAFERCAGRDSVTYTKPHRRRLITQGLILPSYTGYAAGDVVFVQDTSGSMNEKEVAQGLGECDNIIQDCQPKSTVLLGCDAAINSVHWLYQGDSLADNIPPLGGGGGTSFVPPFEWIEEQGILPATVVYFTDMYGDFPDDPGYPVIWCSTSEDEVAPFGETIFVEMDA